MARYSGRIGFAHVVKTSPGVTEEVMTEKGPYYGNITRAARSLVGSENLHDDITISNTIEIVADGYASSNIFAIRYIEWAGALWTVAEASVERPRLLLRLGGVYDGKRAESQDSETSDPA